MSTPGLMRRTLLSGISASVLVAVLTFAAAGAAAAIPRLVARLTAAQLSYELSQLSPTQRDLTGTLTFPAGTMSSTPPSTTAGVFGALDAALRAGRASFPVALRRLTAPASYTSVTHPQKASPVNFVAAANLKVELSADPRYATKLRIERGVAPAVWTAASGPAPIDIIVSEATARAIHAAVGDLVSTQLGGETRQLRVSGIFAPTRASGDYWQNTADLLTPAVEPSAELPVDTISGFVAPGSVGALSSDFIGGGLNFWYPLAVSGITPDNSAAVSRGLHRVEATGIALPGSGTSGGTTSVDTITDETITTAFRGIGAFVALGSLEVAGPFGVVLAVFVLGVRSVIERRRPTLALMAARGGGEVQLRGAMALEGLLIGVPASLVAAAAATVAGPGGGIAALVAPLVVGLVPAVLFAASTSPRGMRAIRTDLRTRSGSRIRRTTEIIVVALAAVGVIVLDRRGLVATSVTVGVDPLLVGTPLLLSLAVCIGVIRLYPIPLRAVQSVLRRRRGAVAFLGASRSIRDPAIGVAAVLALVVGISVATFSSVMLSTIDAGLHTAALETVGSDVAVVGEGVTPTHIRRFAALPGVATVAASDQWGPVNFSSRSVSTDVELILSRTSQLRRIRPDVPSGMDHLIDGRVPVLIAKDFAAQVPPSGDAVVDGTAVRVVGEFPLLSQFGSDREWVLADAALASHIDNATAQPDHALIAAVPGASVPRVAAAVRGVVRADAAGTTVIDAASAVNAIESTPSFLGIRLSLVAAAIVATVLAALAAVLGSLIAATERNRTIGVLRTLGMSPRQAGGLVAWELGPVAVAAIVTGALLGSALPWVVTAAVDLRAFTGATARAVPAYDPLALAAVIGGFAAVTVIATVIAAAIGNRLTPASTLKMGAE